MERSINHVSTERAITVSIKRDIWLQIYQKIAESGAPPTQHERERRLEIMQSVEPVLENVIKVADVRGMGKK
jgi:hypothetical protein